MTKCPVRNDTSITVCSTEISVKRVGDDLPVIQDIKRSCDFVTNADNYVIRNDVCRTGFSLNTKNHLKPKN